MNQSKFGHFLTGALVGVGLGILLAPSNSSKTRNQLKHSLEELVEEIKNIDIEETKANFIFKVDELQKELSSIDKEDAIEMIENKIKLISKKCDEITKEAQKESLPVIEKWVSDIRENATELLSNVANNVEIEKPKKKRKVA